MCGIVGIYDVKSSVSREQLTSAINLLHKRGPDDSGVWLKDNVGLAHRRLAILDLSSSGHQPMKSFNGRFVIVFNGEIYNFKEIREQLSEDEGVWQSLSDTEVILFS